MESTGKEEAQATYSNVEMYMFGRSAGCRGFVSGGEKRCREQKQMECVRSRLTPC